MDDKHHAEIIIIKRHSGHEEEHHGGAWKIAFADFMTAMMAFFLVLWIINATDKNTKTIIARYFNPLKLEDMSKANKGIRQLSGEAEKEPPKADTEGATSTPSEKKKTPVKTGDDPDKKEPPPPQDKAENKDKQGADPAHPKAHLSEAALLGDPYASLDQIAGKVASAGSPQGASKVTSATGGDAGAEAPSVDPDAFVDPFKPVERGASGDAFAPANNAMPSPPAPPQPPTPAAAGVQPPPSPAPSPQPNPAPQPAAAAAEPAPHPAPDGKATAPVSPTEPPPDAAHPGAAPAPAAAPPAPAPAAATAAAPAPAAGANPAPASAPEAAKLQNELAKELRAELHAQAAPGVEVQATPEGILISLTDEYNFSMFAIGSSEPQAKVVRIMDKIALALKSRPGSIVVRGHTDGRQYKSGVYDNWRLSEARAQMAYYMLVRGGLEEKRVDRIEGYADRRLKKPDNPEAAENRRIEILLRKDKG
jgi:chemotaxis protein MotB